MRSPNHLSRRDFLKIGGATSLGLALTGCGRVLTTVLMDTPVPTTIPTTTPTPVPQCITPTPVHQCIDPMSLSLMPIVGGERYEVQVPDTLDLQERARLALSAMTSCTDPQDNYAPYDNFNLWRNPPIMYYKTVFNGKYMEVTALLRSITGSNTNRHVDQTWRRDFLDTIVHGYYPWWGIDPGRLLAWLGNNFRIEKDPCWQELGTQTVGRLSQMMVYKDDYCYYPSEQGVMPTGWEATWGGWMLQGLTQLYLTTKSSDALELASKLARYLKDHALIFDKDAHFLARHTSENGLALHFHHNGNALEGIAA